MVTTAQSGAFSRPVPVLLFHRPDPSDIDSGAKRLAIVRPMSGSGRLVARLRAMPISASASDALSRSRYAWVPPRVSS